MKQFTLHLLLTILLIIPLCSKITLTAASDGESPPARKLEEPETDNKKLDFEVINPEMVQKAYPALGYDLKHGPLWSIVCITKDFGRIPGKLDVKHRGFFTYKYNVYNCEKFFKINGILTWNTGTIPEKCVARGRQKDNQKPLYNILAVTQYGNIPCLLYTSPSPRDLSTSRMPSSA